LRGGSPQDDSLLEKTAWHIARVRTHPEAREGLTAFLEKRSPVWVSSLSKKP
jgi:methylglutaconyl-CoA hydratase